MLVPSKLAKFLIIGTTTFLLAYFSNINPAYAERNGLASGTLILTPKGNIPIEELHPGDRVIGYNFSAHQTEINILSEIRPKSSFSYYLINNQTQIKGTNLVYIKTPTSPKIVRVYQLQVHDKLIRKNFKNYTIEQIEQIVKPSELYQVILEKEKGNFVADNFLIYGGNKIPIKFQIDLDCPVWKRYNGECPSITSKNLSAILLSFVIIAIGIKLFELLWNRFYL